MDCSEARLDTIEAQRSMDVSHKKTRRRYFPMNLIKGAHILRSRFVFQSGRESTQTPTEDTKDVSEFLTKLGLSDIYDLPGEYVAMNHEIFSAMRSENKEFLEKMESYATPIARPLFINL